eukprot:30980-Pelagococcus_subviridis.AAC.3
MSRSFPRHTLGIFLLIFAFGATSPIPPSAQCGCAQSGGTTNATSSNVIALGAGGGGGCLGSGIENHPAHARSWSISLAITARSTASALRAATPNSRRRPRSPLTRFIRGPAEPHRVGGRRGRSSVSASSSAAAAASHAA